MEVKGKLEVKFDEFQVSEKFKKREFVLKLEDNPEYPEFVKFELIQDKCSYLNGAAVGSVITAQFNLKGRKWTDPKDGSAKYFNTLQAWKLEIEAAEPVVADDASVDDLPF